MKKNIIKALIISGIINVVGCLTNLLCAIFGDFLLIKVTYTGGEYQGFLGFGILLEHIYRLAEHADKAIHISFDILNFLVYFVFIFILVFAFIFVINKIKESKEKKSNKKEK